MASTLGTASAQTATSAPSTAAGTIPLTTTSSGTTSSAQLTDAASTGHNIWDELVFAFVGVGALAVVASVSDRAGRVLEALMVGFAFMWFLLHSSTVAGWLSAMINGATATVPPSGTGTGTGTGSTSGSGSSSSGGFKWYIPGWLGIF